MSPTVAFRLLLCMAATRPAVLQSSSRITGGQDVRIEWVPYQLSLQQSGTHKCGAVLISQNRALTAAHCTAGTLSVQGGTVTSQTDPNGEPASVLRVIPHPNYNPNNFDYDISVLHLNTTMELTDKVQPIQLAKSAPKVGSDVFASGWGDTSSNLQGVVLNIVSQSFCKKALSQTITNQMLCAYLAGGRDVCQGDTGGPLVYQEELVGIISWGYGCGRFGSPSVHTNVAKLLKFIKDASGV